MKTYFFLLAIFVVIGKGLFAQQYETAFDRLVKTEMIYLTFNPITFDDEVHDYSPFLSKKASKDFYSPHSGLNLDVLNDFYGLDEYILKSDKYWMKEVFDHIGLSFFPSLKKSRMPTRILLYYNDLAEISEYYYMPGESMGSFTFSRSYFSLGKQKQWLYLNDKLKEVHTYKNDKEIRKIVNEYKEDGLTQTQVLDFQGGKYHKITYAYDNGKLRSKDIFEQKDNKKYKLRKSFKFMDDNPNGAADVLKVYSNNEHVVARLYYGHDKMNTSFVKTRIDEVSMKKTSIRSTYDTLGVLNKTEILIDNSIKRITTYSYLDNGLLDKMKIVENSQNGNRVYQVIFSYSPDNKIYSIERYFVDVGNSLKFKSSFRFSYNEYGNIKKIRRNSGGMVLPRNITFEYYPTMQK